MISLISCVNILFALYGFFNHIPTCNTFMINLKIILISGMSIDDIRKYETKMHAETNQKVLQQTASTPSPTGAAEIQVAAT